MIDDRVCKICDGGPGNECACTCLDGPCYDPIYFYREENARWSDDVLAISVRIFLVVKFTPAGCWIVPEWDHPERRFQKFVPATSFASSVKSKNAQRSMLVPCAS